MPKKILYLDQLFISNLAKVEGQPGWKDLDRDYYQALLGLLRTNVDENRLACPTSPFHREESERHHWLNSIIWPLVEELSRGLTFNHATEIHFSQIALAARNYCGSSLPSVPDWALAFNQDPQKQITGFERDQILVQLESPQGLIDKNKDVAELVAEIYDEFKSIQQEVPFADQVQIQKYQLLAETFIPAKMLFESYPELHKYFGILEATALTQRQATVLRILEGCPNAEEFWKSHYLLECPFLHCRASLMAANIGANRKMKITPSLNTDFEIVASILPYVDMMATDNHMAELIRQAKLSEKFNAKVYSMNQRDQLLNELECL